MEHTRQVILAGSKYEGRQCPVTKQPLMPGATVVICPRTDTAMAEIVFVEQPRCPFCSHVTTSQTVKAPAAAGLPAAKPLPVRPVQRSRIATAAVVAGVASLLVMFGALSALLSPSVSGTTGGVLTPTARAGLVSGSQTAPSLEPTPQMSPTETTSEAAEQPTEVVPVITQPEPVRVAAPAIIPRDEWSTRAPGSGMAPQHPVRIVLSHEEGDECCEKGDALARVRSNEGVHRGPPRGWPDIGYHFIISPVGEVYEGRAVRYRVDSSYAQVNPDYPLDGTIVIGLLGNYNRQTPTDSSISITIQLMAWLCQEYSIDPDDIYYLRDLAPKHVTGGPTTSPGTHMPSRQIFRDAVRELLGKR